MCKHLTAQYMNKESTIRHSKSLYFVMPMQGNVKFNLKKEDNFPTITKTILQS